MVSDEEIRELIKSAVLGDSNLHFAPPHYQAQIAEHVFLHLRKEMGILQPLQDDDTISEIMVNGTEHIFAERQGIIEEIPLSFLGTEDIEDMSRRLAAKVHREINDLNPIVDARMNDGSRFHAVAKNVAIDGPVINIRKFPKGHIGAGDLLTYETITPQALRFLERSVQAGLNIFVSGGTSSGKTTFLNVLTDFIPPKERVIVLEDSAELQIRNLVNVVRMETKDDNSRNKGKVTMSDLIRSSLRMRPDRIIVGEVRGNEVMDMIQAMNTGHDGSLSTGHGNSPRGMLARLEALYLTAVDYPLDAVRSQIGEAINLICHMGRLPNGQRKVFQIVEIAGVVENQYIINEIFNYKFNKGLVATGKTPIRWEKAEQRGICFEPDLFETSPD